MTSEQKEVLRFQIRSKNVLTQDEAELFELTQLAGITMDPSVFKIILDLLKLNVDPTAILHMLKLMCDPQQQKAAVDTQDFITSSAPTFVSSHTTTQSRSHKLRSTNINKGQQPTSSSSSSRLKDYRR
ncbi:hypothetical protein C0Q70_08334 [Pomacea canaliculata]|uniref:Uncharacterized protein n=1 Tax=Pomacea canaliculata TaxID=400727 RepID=A0A2T7PHK5_POMCA|nr:mitotic-spindle organizing protein 2-like [Pomacea canaliculata]PVD32887.1 hypothetical protein C0Q70_08334 [Pomacea canaliculata]